MSLKPSVKASIRARLQHSDENTSDYLEIIAELIQESGEARPVDLAERLGVSKATVSKKVRQLQRDGLVRCQPYRSIFLEPAGARQAAASKRLHQTVLDFLVAAGVPQDVAEMDAEGIEHHVSPKTVAALKSLTERLKRDALN